MDDFIERWNARIAGALDEALTWLAQHDRSPYSDGMLGDWLRQLCAFRFEERHVPAIAALIGKADPLLQEAGVKLGSAALGSIDCADALEPALARVARRPVDSWILLALVELLGRAGAQMTSVYRELVKPSPPRDPGRFGIMRNRYIDPERELVALYEQHMLQTLHPSERDLLFLPILEAKHRTSGWRATLLALLKSMNLDPEHHLRLLGER